MSAMSESTRKGSGLRVVGLAVVCFGAGLVVGMGWYRGRDESRKDAGGLFSGRPWLSAMGAPAVVDEGAQGIYARLVGAGREDFVRELGRLPEWDGSSPTVRAKWMALAIRWVLEDAEDGAGFLMEQREDAKLKPFAKLFRDVWAKQDLAGASAFSEGLVASGHEVSWWMKGSCEAAQREADPDGFLRGLPTEDYYERRNEIAASIARFATTEPGKAAAFLAEMGDCQERRTSVVELGHKWARHDPAAARSWALGVADEWERYLAFDAVISELAKSDLPAAMASYRELIEMGAEPVITNVVPTLESHEKIAAALARKNPGEALQWVNAMGLAWMSDFVLTEMDGLLPNDPAAFRSFLEAMELEETRLEMAESFRVDFNADPATLFGEMVNLPRDAFTTALLRESVRQWMAVDAGATRRAILALPEGPRAEAGAEALEQTGRFKSTEEAITFAREAGVTAIGEEFTDWVGVRDDVRVAADYLASGRSDALPAIMARWASRSPAEAAAWSATLPDEALRARLVEPLVNEWVGKDSLAASEWVASLDAGPVREAGANRLARALLQVEPASAFAWALTLGDRDERAWLARDAYRNWHRRAPVDATGALGAAEIPPELRESLRSSP